jgi:hypothetical protein
MITTADQQATKAWAQRNSDGKLSLGDEYMTEDSKRIQSPPAFTLTDAELPTGTVRLANPDEDTGRAIVHEHVWSVENPDE